MKNDIRMLEKKERLMQWLSEVWMKQLDEQHLMLSDGLRKQLRDDELWRI
ncbi:hypothetical protein GW891_04370 [bacterium]|nr:hypothetical protein [bacterium]